jgi:hypothetical protein
MDRQPLRPIISPMTDRVVHLSVVETERRRTSPVRIIHRLCHDAANEDGAEYSLVAWDRLAATDRAAIVTAALKRCWARP